MAYGRKATADERFKIGEIGFLVQDDDDYVRISREPGRMNLSREERLHGWLGSWNNVSSHAQGLGRVVAECDDDILRRRIYRVVPVAPSKVTAALESLGHPGLAS